jgi:hypothetical protein
MKPDIVFITKPWSAMPADALETMCQLIPECTDAEIIMAEGSAIQKITTLLGQKISLPHFLLVHILT